MKNQFKRMAFFGAVTLFAISCSDEAPIEIEEQNLQLEEKLTHVVTFDSRVIPNSYIVVFEEKVVGNIGARHGDNYAAARMAVKLEAQKMFVENKISDFQIQKSYSKVLSGVSVNMTESAAKKLSTDRRVAYIEKDQLVSLAPPPGKGPGGGGGGSSDPQETPWGISRVNGVSDYTGNSVAWILDTGIDLDHPDLTVDASRGFNAFTNGRDSKSLDDGNGHGTHVSGTVAALNNDIGVIGVAPGATVIPVKVLDSRGSGSYSGVIAGIDHVGANGSPGDVANMSLGGGFSQAVNDAVINASNNGIEFALAAGNESTDAATKSPASANGPNIYTISAMGQGDNWASFSNFGNPPVDFCEPGVSVKSTWKDGGYNTISGTSMAAPHAAGLLLLGNIGNGGLVNGDPDGDADTIGVN